jgi:hypothetical protein
VLPVILVQACGDNTLALLLEFAREVKKQESVPLSETDAEGSVYVDFLSLVLVRGVFRTFVLSLYQAAL